MDVTRHKPSTCPQCNYKMDASSILIENVPNRKPQSGDFTLCMNCGQILVYKRDLSMRKVTPDEVLELMDDDDTWAMIEYTQYTIKTRGKFFV